MSRGVHLHGLTRRFAARTVLDQLDLTIAPGEFVAMVGRSGSGKSTLLRFLAGLDTEAFADEADVPSSVAVAFQEPRLLPWQRVWRNVLLGLGSRGTRERAERALSEVELSGRADAWPLTLSGGEAQRVSLARALVHEPDLLLLDEPFAAVDALTRIALHELVLSLWRAHGPSILLVTHDIDEAVRLADRIVVLDEGRIAHEETLGGVRPRDTGDGDLAGVRQRVLERLRGATPTG